MKIKLFKYLFYFAAKKDSLRILQTHIQMKMKPILEYNKNDSLYMCI